MSNLTIYLASDHGGFEYKNKLAEVLAEQNYQVENLGPDALDPKDDYPDFAFPLAEKVATDNGSLGIMFCRGGQGMAIAANKVKGIRAAVCWNKKSAADSKKDNDTNILSLSADDLTWEEITAIVTTWLETPFSREERHVRRIQKITDYEQ
ncbi:RpiB/LacA/LacB family sugar-phosphate isomerase [Patescibacteria group bacterium]